MSLKPQVRFKIFDMDALFTTSSLKTHLISLCLLGILSLGEEMKLFLAAVNLLAEILKSISASPFTLNMIKQGSEHLVYGDSCCCSILAPTFPFSNPH